MMIMIIIITIIKTILMIKIAIPYIHHNDTGNESYNNYIIDKK